MITGTHVLLYTRNAEADRAFFRDVLQFRAVDAGEGWLIFALPPAEMGIHPGGSGKPLAEAELYLMCDDLQAAIASLTARGVQCSPVTQAGWGSVSIIPLPSGAAIGIYQPRHRTAIG